MKRREAKVISQITQRLSGDDQEIKLLYEQQEYILVIAKCDIRLLTVPGDVNILYYKALACSCLDRNKEADICIQNILAINPEHKGAIIFQTERNFDKDFTNSNRELSDELLTKIQQYVQAVSANQALLNGLQRMSSTLEGNLQTSIIDCAVSYQQVFANEIAKQEQDPNYLLNDKAIRAAREALTHNNSNLDGLKTLKEEAEALKNQFPEEFTKFSKLFKLLARVENNQEFKQQLKQISQNLGISSKSLENLYKITSATKPVPNSNTTIKQLSIEELESELPEYKKATKNSDIKPLGQILAELVIGTDKEWYVAPEFTSAQIEKFRGLEQHIEQALIQYKSDYGNNPEVLKLINSFQQVKKYYESWQNSSLNSIRSWADAKKGNLTNSIDATCEAIAVMDRANELVTGGHYLRDTQVIATLAFLQSENGQGKLCQIKTGEGKTTIVSLLAVIKVLQGETVDIITSNPVLAEEGVKEKKSFYAVFNLTAETNNNDPKYVSGPRECYKADILYGCISSFQFDYLRDSFERLQTRAERKFGSVILDEVDSMLIDNGGNIAKLSGPLPGMESLRYVYIKIWAELTKAEEKLTNDLNNQLTNKAKELAYKTESTLETQKEFYQFRQEQFKSVRVKIKDLIKASNPHKIELIPAHIQEYARDKLDRWIDNAIYAKYSCYKDQQYIIKKNNDENGKGEYVVVPVDYANTGITLKNTIWSHGLHQFVQLKHNLHLTAESLTSSFISNVGYIKHYGDKIFGLTGTLGSVAEQKLLSKMYNVSYAKIPTFKAKDFTENKGYVVDDEDWDIYMAADALEKCETGRAVLIICETIADVKNIEDNLNKLKIIARNQGEETQIAFNVKIFTDEDLAHVTEDKLGPGDIIIATNIAGRGTDLGTTEELEANGGLHVCVGFLPCNQRVEEQAFGRTARQGKKGTAELILRKSEVSPSRDGYGYYDFEVIKRTRDKLEQERINEIEEKKLKELNFNDALFDKFSELYVKLKEENDEAIGFLFVLQDLKEYWAFWLEQQDFKLDSAELDGKVEEEFNRFKTSNTTSSIISGNITHNPYYSIKQAESYLQSDNKVDEALKSLEQAISISENPDILYSAYMKLFEVAIEQGEQLKERFKKAVAQCFFIKVNKDEKYKDKAVEALDKAKKALEKEIKYLSSYFEEQSEFSTLLIVPEEGEDNFLTKHLLSRLYCLQTYSNNVDGLLDSIEQFSDGVSVSSKVPNYLKKLDSNNMHEKDLKDRINDVEVLELSFVSLDAIYSLKEVHDASETVILRAQAQIGGGLASLAIGLAFPPALPICGPVAGALIGEGICDIVMELISQGNDEFSEAEYAKGKAISYGISIATMGISAIATSIKILSAASKACKGLAKLLSKSPFLKTICTKVSQSLEKLGKWFDKLHLEQFNKLSQSKQLEHLEKLQKVGKLEELKYLGGVEKLSNLQHLKEAGKLKELSRIQHLSAAIKNIAIDSGQDVVGSVVMEKVIMASLQELLEKLKPLIQEKVKSGIEDNSSLKDELKTVTREVISTNAQEVLTDEMSEIIGEVAKEIALGVARHSHNWKVKMTSLTIDSIISVDQILKYAKKFSERLLSKLSDAQDNSNDGTGDLNGIIEELSAHATEKIYSLVTNLVSKYAHTLIVSPMVSKGFEIAAGIIGSKKAPTESENSLAPRVDEESPQTKTDRAYETLGLDPKTATPKEIRKAYLVLALKNHPDKGGSQEAMQRINNAYSLIKQYGANQQHEQTFNSNQGFSASNTSEDDRGNGTNCRHISIAQLFNGIEGGQVHTSSSIARDYTTSQTAGRLNVLDKILQTRYQNMELIKKDNLSPLELKSWMQDHSLDSCLLAIVFDNPITVNGQNVSGHVTFARLDTNGEIMICDRQIDPNGNMIPEMSLSNYFNYIKASPQCLHVRQLIDKRPTLTLPIIVKPNSELSGDGVDALMEDDLVRLVNSQLLIAEVMEANPADDRNSTDMDIGGTTQSKPSLLPADWNTIKDIAQPLTLDNHTKLHELAKFKPIYPNNQGSTKEIELLNIVFLELKEVNNTLIIIKNKNMFDSEGSDSAPLIPAYNIPFLTQDTGTFENLQKNSVTVPLFPGNNDPKLAITGTFTGCSLILGVGEHDIKIFHDAKPNNNKIEKEREIIRENRYITRVDHADSVLSEGNGYYSYTTQAPDDNSIMLKVNMFLSYNEDTQKWYIIKQRVADVPQQNGITCELHGYQIIPHIEEDAVNITGDMPCIVQL